MQNVAVKQKDYGMESANTILNKNPFKYADLGTNSQDRIAKSLDRIGTPGDNAAWAWDSVIDFLINDEKGQFLGTVIYCFIKNKLARKSVSGHMTPAAPQVVLIGENGGPEGICRKIKAMYGITGILEDYKSAAYPPGSPALVQEITRFFNSFFETFNRPQGGDLES